MNGPGNVRQLQTVLQRAIVLGCEDFITVDDVSREIPEHGPNEDCDPERNMKRKLVEHALIQSDGNYRMAAALLKRDPKNMHRTVHRLNLSHLIKGW
jgi:DNA-binding NtrC family response regulator